MENMFRLSNGQATAKRLRTDDAVYKANANECLTLHLIDNAVQHSSWPPKPVASFKADFTHQIFGDDEQIYGYRALKIDVYFSQQDFRACVDISFSDKVPGAVEVFNRLKEHFPAGLTNNKQRFLSDIFSMGVTSRDLTNNLGVSLPVPSLRPGLSVVQTALAQGSQQLKVGVYAG